ncbi:MAG TPA: DegT/DnrJ/EryC1/StrS family aminotransferase [Chitinophagaceae bacterium]|nr:DegT/DnrJ/EryC1/StrS family aminotransferase [Chitinophagaceae bacterium]
MINVTKSFLPPLEEYQRLIAGIWERSWLTNHGPLVTELEQKLGTYLGIPYVLFLSNGTVALQIAIKALELKGEIITTPFSYVATTNSILWEGCSPVFADIDKETLNIDPLAIESKITSRTSAILATHVYGNPCDIEAIELLAQKYHLKVIYDAAHCFGSKYKDQSVYCYGDISTASFHATKLFHTGEGGAVFTLSNNLYEKLSLLRNFGHISPEEFALAGINGKNSELHAAMGLSILPYIEGIICKRRELSLLYDLQLQNLSLSKVRINKHATFNYAYYPVIFESEGDLLKVISTLKDHNIIPRRYFFPSLNTLSYVGYHSAPISESISKRVLCLPLYYDLREEDIEQISQYISQTLNTKKWF